jgi:hypothetical protein
MPDRQARSEKTEATLSTCELKRQWMAAQSTEWSKEFQEQSANSEYRKAQTLATAVKVLIGLQNG